jgi:hypothetical protein
MLQNRGGRARFRSYMKGRERFLRQTADREVVQAALGSAVRYADRMVGSEPKQRCENARAQFRITCTARCRTEDGQSCIVPCANADLFPGRWVRCGAGCDPTMAVPTRCSDAAWEVRHTTRSACTSRSSMNMLATSSSSPAECEPSYSDLRCKRYTADAVGPTICVADSYSSGVATERRFCLPDGMKCNLSVRSCDRRRGCQWRPRGSEFVRNRTHNTDFAPELREKRNMSGDTANTRSTVRILRRCTIAAEIRKERGGGVGTGKITRCIGSCGTSASRQPRRAL